MNWQIVQQQDGKADIELYGTIGAGGTSGESPVAVKARVVREDSGETVLPWKECILENEYRWRVKLPNIPAGGLYRLETALEAAGADGQQLPGRGDMVHHFGVGDIFVIAGQSNASGRGKDTVYDPPEIGVHLLRNNGKWDLASHPMNETTGSVYEHHFETDNPGHSPYLAFAKILKRNLCYPIGLIQTALGGSGLWQWNPGEEGSLYRNMVRIVKENAGGVKGILWYQGCADGFEEKGSNYLERFRNMAEHLRNDLQNAGLPFFTVQLNRCTIPPEEKLDRSWGMVREAQRQAAAKIPGVYVVPANDCKMYDYIHNSASSDITLGERTASAALSELYGRNISWRAPEVVRAVRSGPAEVILEFRNVSNRLELFELDANGQPFTVEDCDGRIPVQAWSLADRTKVCLKLSRELRSDGVVHGAYEMNPVYLIPYDSGNQPMLSFYGLKIEVDREGEVV